MEHIIMLAFNSIAESRGRVLRLSVRSLPVVVISMMVAHVGELICLHRLADVYRVKHRYQAIQQERVEPRRMSEEMGNDNDVVYRHNNEQRETRCPAER